MLVVRLQYSKRQRIVMVLANNRTQSVTEINAFMHQFPGVRGPCYVQYCHKNAEKYDNEGTLLNMNKGRCGRRQSAHSRVNIPNVQ